MKFKRQQIIFLSLLVFVATLLRSYKLQQLAYFNADQEDFAFKAVEIIRDKNFTLLGFKAGQADVYIGPLMYYVYALIYLLGNFNPFSLQIFHLILGSFTLVSIYYIVQRLYSRQTAILASLIYAFSPMFIDWDQRAWLPTPLIFVSLWIYYLLSHLSQKNQLSHLFILGLLLAFSFQLHLVGLLFYPVILLWLLIKKFKPNIKSLSLGMATAFIGFVPIIAFDLRHNFLNLNNWIALLNSTANLFSRFKRLFLILQTHGNILFAMVNISISKLLATFSFLILLTALFIKKNQSSRLQLLFLTIPILLFTFVSLPTPEYYFVIAFPVLLLIWSQLIYKIYKFNKYLGLIPLFIFILISTKKVLTPNLNGRISLYNKKQAIQYIKDNSVHPISVNRLIEPAHNFGFDYMFHWILGYIPKQGDLPDYSLVVPNNFQDIKSELNFGGIGIISHKN